MSNVTVYHGDSREVLKKLLKADGRIFSSSGSPIIYTDSHWYEDLPLADELMIIFSQNDEAVVVIDDFQVPGDPGYGYDDYGPGKALNSEYIERIVQQYGLLVGYPTMPSADESGGRKGCVVLAKESAWGEKLRSLPELRVARL
jgi:hypothetical protein